MFYQSIILGSICSDFHTDKDELRKHLKYFSLVVNHGFFKGIMSLPSGATSANIDFSSNACMHH